MKRPVVFAAAALLGVLACGPTLAEESKASSQNGTGPVAGSGRMVTEKRSPGSFQSIDLRGSMTLVVRQTGREAVEVRADDNLLPLVETVVVKRAGDGQLRIDSRGSYSTRNDIVVTVDVITLKGLAVSGSGDAVAEGIKADTLQTSVSGSGNLKLRQLSAGEWVTRLEGSGDIEASGRAARVNLSIAGSGDVESRKLEAEEVRVDIAGSGNASVNARKTLNVSIAGSGDVVYSGEPVVKSTVVGSGSVHKR